MEGCVCIMYISVLYIGIVSFISQALGYNFGYNNGYTCHCNNDVQCDAVTGVCPGGCVRGWGGPSCQKENVALNKPASQSGQYGQQGPYLAVDGNRDSLFDGDINNCSDTDYSPRGWWLVNLQQPYSIRDIIIYHKTGRDYYLEFFKGFKVEIQDVNKAPVLCYQHDGESRPPVKNIVDCGQSITGQYVNISNYRPDLGYRYFMAVCEVEVYVCARGTYGGDCNSFCHCANNERCDVRSGQCPSGGCQIGWHGDSCSSECESGKYGLNCSLSCSARFCKTNSATCDRETGVCGPDGCLDYYDGVDCTQYIGCAEGFYGPNCVMVCADRKCKVSSSVCDKETGDCGVEGCQQYYGGIDCINNTGCAEGYYGLNSGCDKVCSERNCQSLSSCDEVIGACDNYLCTYGFTGIDCTMTETGSGTAYSKGLNNVTTGIIGSVIGLVIGIIIAIVVYKLWMKRKQIPEKQDDYYEDISMDKVRKTRNPKREESASKATSKRSSNKQSHDTQPPTTTKNKPYTSTSHQQPTLPSPALSTDYVNISTTVDVPTKGDVPTTHDVPTTADVLTTADVPIAGDLRSTRNSPDSTANYYNLDSNKTYERLKRSEDENNTEYEVLK